MNKIIKALQKNKPNFQVFIMALATAVVSSLSLYLAILALKAISGS